MFFHLIIAEKEENVKWKKEFAAEIMQLVSAWMRISIKKGCTVKNDAAG